MVFGEETEGSFFPDYTRWVNGRGIWKALPENRESWHGLNEQHFFTENKIETLRRIAERPITFFQIQKEFRVIGEERAEKARLLLLKNIRKALSAVKTNGMCKAGHSYAPLLLMYFIY